MLDRLPVRIVGADANVSLATTAMVVALAFACVFGLVSAGVEAWFALAMVALLFIVSAIEVNILGVLRAYAKGLRWSQAVFIGGLWVIGPLFLIPYLTASAAFSPRRAGMIASLVDIARMVPAGVIAAGAVALVLASGDRGFVAALMAGLLASAALGTLAFRRGSRRPALLDARAGHNLSRGYRVRDSMLYLVSGGLLVVSMALTMDWLGHPGAWLFLAVYGMSAMGAPLIARRAEIAAVKALAEEATSRSRVVDLSRQLDATEHEATTDALTDLGNRLLFDRHLQAAKDDDAPPSLLILGDVAGLKVVNDTRGHPAGDQLLRAVGRALASTIREGDGAYRFGGDEYGVLARSVGPSFAEALLARLADAVADEIAADAALAGCTAWLRMGWAHSDDGRINLYERADAMLTDIHAADVAAGRTGRG
jgi:diguanylate cyclase (GGDEF)-like protein